MSSAFIAVTPARKAPISRAVSELILRRMRSPLPKARGTDNAASAELLSRLNWRRESFMVFLPVAELRGGGDRHEVDLEEFRLAIEGQRLAFAILQAAANEYQAGIVTLVEQHSLRDRIETHGHRRLRFLAGAGRKPRSPVRHVECARTVETHVRRTQRAQLHRALQFLFLEMREARRE